MDDFEDLEDFVHNEDSFHPTEIDDYERPLTDDEEELLDILYTAMDDLEEATKDPTKETAEIPMDSALKALQLLRAYSTLFELELSDYERDYTE